MKNFYYVVVFTENGAKFVTKVSHANKTCEWLATEKPLKFATKESAQNIALGLTCNFNFAVAVNSTYEIEQQPYNYERGHFEWKRDDKND